MTVKDWVGILGENELKIQMVVREGIAWIENHGGVWFIGNNKAKDMTMAWTT